MKKEKRGSKAVPVPIKVSALAKDKKPPAALTPATKPAVKPVSTIHLELYAPHAREVFVAGSFNEWRPAETAMFVAGSGKWARDLELPPGRYEYLFRVDGQWLPDPQAKQYAPNPFGGQNCLVEIPKR